MSSDEELRWKRPRVWPSLLIAAIPAIYLPLEWINRRHNQPLDFTILFSPIYIALAFGILWPILVGLQALVMRSARRAHLWRYRVAPVLFALSVLGWVPFVMLEVAVIKRERAENLRMAQWREHVAAEESVARQAIAAKGVLAFTEPLQDEQAGVLVRHIYDHALTSGELQRMSEQYQDPMVMNELAQKTNCPPEALEILFAKAMSERGSTTPTSLQWIQQTLNHIGRNASTPVEVLVKMVESDEPAARMAAAANPHLPKAAKISYLKKACNFLWESEMREAGNDPDTPPEILECLSTKPGGDFYVASNPNTPIHVLEALSHSDIHSVKKAAHDNLAKRDAVPQ